MLEPTPLLLVDDEARNLDALESILDDPAYRLLRARTADDALRFLLVHDVAAIVLDVKMPDVSGFELARLIKGTKRFQEVPVLFLTAHRLEQAEIESGYGAGAIDVLMKPVNPQVLRHKIALFVDLFQKTRALAALNATLEQRVRERTQELEVSQAALKEGGHQRDLFLATLAHELRNPLAPLRTGLDILMRHFGNSGAHRAELAAMDRQLVQIIRVMEDLLDLARISRKDLLLSRVPTDLFTALLAAVEVAAPWMERRRQLVAIEGEPSMVATVDGQRIAQIVLTLLQNASKHSPEGCVIGLGLHRTPAHAVIAVTDPGVGFDADQLQFAFELPVTHDRSVHGGNDGLGISLSLARQLALLHGGSLTASSPGLGRGATFVLSVPVA